MNDVLSGFYRNRRGPWGRVEYLGDTGLTNLWAEKSSAINIELRTLFNNPNSRLYPYK